MQKSNAKQQELTIKNFIEALKQLKEVGSKDKKYQDIKIEEWFDENNGYKVKEDLRKKDKITMCKYLMYLFAGALAEDVHVATGNTIHKGLNKKIKDMSDKDFCKLLKKIVDNKTTLMNETGAYRWGRVPIIPFFALEPNTCTPSGAFNDGIQQVAIMMSDSLNLQQTNDEFIKKFLTIFNETRTEIQKAKKFDRCCIKRPGINIARCFKRFFGKQDFSYTNSKYEPVFKPLNLKDTNKDKSIEK